MERNIHKNLLNLLKSKGLLVVSAGMLLVSCSVQVGGYSETDGVYYNPNTDVLPEGVMINDNYTNRVGEEYDYQDNTNIIANAQENVNNRETRYEDWQPQGASSSDWGTYAGAETNIYNYNNWGMGLGWGGFNNYWGYGGFGGGWNMGLSFGWGNGWGWSGYSPYWGYGGFSPYWGYGAMSPYWGMAGYHPYWGWGGGYTNYWNTPYYGIYRRSGSSGRSFNRFNGPLTSNRVATRSSGFRTFNGTQIRNSSNTGGFRNQSANATQGGTRGGFRNNNGAVRPTNNGIRYQTGGFRNNTGTYRPETQQPTRPTYQNNGGSRPSGGFSTPSSGGFRGGSSSSGGSMGGGMRSGGGGGFRGGR